MDKKFLSLALKHQLPIEKILSTNELGLDFTTAIGEDTSGHAWILRIPRRDGMLTQIEHEESSLNFLRPKVAFNVPNWKVATAELVAYPLLTDKPALEVNPATQGFIWNINLESNLYAESLASILYELHTISTDEAESFGIKKRSPDEVRQKLLDDILFVKNELGLAVHLETKWRSWINDDTYWPHFSVLIHGDLYAGHTLVDSKNKITGLIDWSEIQISDASLDFVGHYIGLGEAQLDRTLEAYKKMGGKTWSRMKDHIVQSSAATSLKFAVFALGTGSDVHIQAAKEQLKGP